MEAQPCRTDGSISPRLFNNCQKRKHNRHSNIDVGRKTNNRCYSKLPNHEQRYTDHRQIPFSLTSKKYIEIKKE